MNLISSRVRIAKGDRCEEYDILACSNGELSRGMTVEVKNHLRLEDIAQMKRKMNESVHFLPGHRDKTFHGVVACVSGSAEAKKSVIANGWYLAHIGEDLFELEVPENFVPRDYTADAA
jgi:hypothetical protein